MESTPTPPPENSPGTSQPPAAREGGSDALAQRALKQVASLLERADGRQAVRVYLQMLAHESATSQAGRLEWVVAQIGKPAAAKLVSAMASFPCFSCRGGMEECLNCRGTGFAAVAQICNACIGLGKARCDFCNGTGLATYNLLPLDFRPAIITRRIARARRTLEKLLPQIQGNPAAATSAAVDPQTLVYGLNKLLGVLENAVLTARQLARDGVVDLEWMQRVESAVAAPADAALDAQRTALQQLAARQQAGADAAMQQDPVNAEDVAARAEFLQALLSGGEFRGTLLHHPFLPTAR